MLAEEVAIRARPALPPFSALALLSGALAPDYAEALAAGGRAVGPRGGAVVVSALGDGRYLVQAPAHGPLCDLLAEVAAAARARPARRGGPGGALSPRAGIPSGARVRARGAPGRMGPMPGLTIRQYGDPVLKERTRDVEEIDGSVASLVDSMIETMYAAPGHGPGRQPDRACSGASSSTTSGEGARTVINPRIVESDGEWVYDEGCLSVPGLSWEIVRPNAVHLVGLDLDGNEISIEATELEGRVFQHELDHLDGILLVERLDEDQRKEALKILRSRTLDLARPSDPDGLTNLFSR